MFRAASFLAFAATAFGLGAGPQDGAASSDAQEAASEEKEKAPPKLVVEPADDPIAIEESIGKEGAWATGLRLSADGDVKELLFLPSDLVAEEGAPSIDRKHVRLVGDRTLTAGVPKDFRVEVDPPARPGTYSGTIELLVAGRPRAEAVRVPIELRARGTAHVSLLRAEDKLDLELVNANRGLSSLLAGWILPDSALRERWTLRLENDGLAGAKLAAVTPVIDGAKSGAELEGALLTLPAASTELPAGRITSLAIAVDRTKLAPDRYEGTIYFELEESEERLALPVDVAVRSGPLLPCLLLVLGILLGRLVKYMQERGGPQSEALQALHRLRVRMTHLPAEDRRLLAGRLEAARRAAYRGELEDAKKAAEELDRAVDALEDLDVVRRLFPEDEDGISEDVRDLVARIRRGVALGEDVQSLFAELKTKVSAGDMMDADAAPPMEVKRALFTIEEAQKRVRPLALAPEPPPESRSEKALRLFASASGISDAILAEGTLLFVRPALYLVTIVGLLIVGLDSLYVESGATFGADPLGDNLGLVLWGLSADVAGRTLSNLKGASS